VKWKEVVEQAFGLARKYYYQNRIAVTVRGLFYIMVSKEILPNTRSAYKTLSREIAKARYYGEFPAYLIRDVTRAREDLEPYEFYPEEPLSEEDLKARIEEIIDEHVSVNINPWEDQPKRVIVLIEKEAQFALVTKDIKENFEHGVYQVVFSRGYNSATDMIRLARLIERINDRGKHVVLLIITDFDPSGEDIARDYSDRLLKINPNLDFEAEKVAVTKEQIEEFNLPSTPESRKEIAKLQRDPRYAKFVAQHGLMRVELDALVALKPDDFRRILIDAIRRHFDEDIYREVTLPRQEKIRDQAMRIRLETIENLRRLIKTLE